MSDTDKTGIAELKYRSNINIYLSNTNFVLLCSVNHENKQNC